jgi:hypothetical protein
MEPSSPETPVRPPYPYNRMNPASVPEEVWRRAREARENERAGCGRADSEHVDEPAEPCDSLGKTVLGGFSTLVVVP